MFPSISIPLNISFGRSSSKEKTDSTVPAFTSGETPAVCISSDAVLVLMLIAVIIMSSAFLVYAARH